MNDRDELAASNSAGSLASRASWSIVDQAISSATNFAVALVLARTLGPDEFGRFAIAFAIWLFVDSVARPMFVQPYLVESATLSTSARAHTGAHVAGAGVMVGAIAGAIVAAVSILGPFDGSTSRTLLALAATLPGLVLQDVLRFVGLSIGRPGRVALNDLIWAVVQAVLLALLWSSDRLSAPTATAAWGIGAGVAAVVAIRQFSTMPVVGGSTAGWASSTARVGGWFTLANLLASASTFAVTLVVARRVGTDGAGAVRAVQSLFSPIALVSTGTEGIALPEATRAAAAGPTRFRRSIRLYGLVLVLPAVVVGGIMVLTADALIGAVLGDAFVRYADLITPFAVAMVAAAAASAAMLGLRALAEGTALVTAQAPPAVTKAVLCWLLVGPYGIEGAGWAVAIGNGLHLALVWVLLARAVRSREALGAPREAASC